MYGIASRVAERVKAYHTRNQRVVMVQHDAIVMEVAKDADTQPLVDIMKIDDPPLRVRFTLGARLSP